MSPHVERMLVERDQLDERVQKLSVFMLTLNFDALDVAEKVRMRCQRQFMRGYLDVLNERIRAAT